MATEVGMIISPVTGQKVLGIRKTNDDTTVFVRELNSRTERIELTGNAGSIFNYVTLEHYGKGSIIRKF
jgi:hypothetical protein